MFLKNCPLHIVVQSKDIEMVTLLWFSGCCGELNDWIDHTMDTDYKVMVETKR